MLLRPRLSLRRQPQQERSAFTFNVVLEAASRLVDERGPEDLKMTELAELAGISVGSLYQYFPDRNSVLVALVDKVCGAVATHLDEVAEQHAEAPLDDLLRALADTVVEDIFRNRRLKAFIQREVLRLSLSGDVVDASEEFVALMAKALRRHSGVGEEVLWTTSRLMVWSADGMLDGIARNPEACARALVADSLYSAWLAMSATVSGGSAEVALSAS
jgi:AcrR family transcriptional regulator